MIRHERELIHRYFYGTRFATTNNATLLHLSIAAFFADCFIVVWILFGLLSPGRSIINSHQKISPERDVKFLTGGWEGTKL